MKASDTEVPDSTVAAAGSCRQWQTGTYSGTGSYRYTGQQTVPSWSSCQDINVTNISRTTDGYNCAHFRVRFYPSSGGSYTNSWQWECTSYSGELDVIASNVLNGTTYRIETYGTSHYSFVVLD